MFHLLLAIIYISFISLGLPDALLGSAWPVIYPQFNVPVSYAGIISMIISLGTIFSSLHSDRMTKSFGPGKVTAASVALTALALFGFSISDSFIELCLWSVPYGLGAGGVDASLNNYVALHYKSHHMSWLHCMWGLGASIGPYIMGYAMSRQENWHLGYGYIAIMQVALTAIIFFSLPLWKNTKDNLEASHSETEASGKALSIREILSIPGAKAIFIMFFCYCALEQTAGLWASSFLALYHRLDVETAASFASLFYIGITIGRALSGFVTMKLNDTKMIRLGQIIIALGILLLLLPFGKYTALAGLITIGLGCAPIYPCVIHSTPALFGADKSQAIIGVQMACAYIGNLLMPPFFGVIASYIGVGPYPVFLLAILALMVWMHRKLLICTKI